MWWLSFAGEEGFRGVAIVEGHDLITAVLATHVLKINPGGQVLGVEIPRGLGDAIPAHLRNKLLSRAETLLADPGSRKLGDLNEALS